MSNVITSRPTEADRLFHTTMALDLVLSEVDRLTAELDAVNRILTSHALHSPDDVKQAFPTLIDHCLTIKSVTSDLENLDQLVVDMLGDGSSKGGH